MQRIISILKTELGFHWMKGSNVRVKLFKII